jgi:hypothetical protein
VDGRCAAVLSAGRRCPNASLAGSRYCGLPQHQALARFATNQVTVLAPLEQSEIAILADPAADEAEAARLVQKAEAAFEGEADGGRQTAGETADSGQQAAEETAVGSPQSAEAASPEAEPGAAEGAPGVPDPDEAPDLETAREDREQAERELSEAEEQAAEQIEEADERLGEDRELESGEPSSRDGGDGTEAPQRAEETTPVGAEAAAESEAAAEDSNA